MLNSSTAQQLNSRTEVTASKALHNAVEVTLMWCNHQNQQVIDPLGEANPWLDEV